MVKLCHTEQLESLYSVAMYKGEKADVLLERFAIC